MYNFINRLSTSAITLMLVSLSIMFIFPFLWMVSTALKPIEQTMTLPPVWLPRAYYIQQDQERIRVIFNEKSDVLSTPSVLVRLLETPRKGEEIVVAENEIVKGRVGIHLQGDAQTLVETPVEIVRKLPVGTYRVMEKLPQGFFERPARIFYVAKSDIESKIKFEFRNFWHVTQKIPFFMYMKNTLIVCVLGVIGSLVSNTLVAYGFSKIYWRGRETAFYITLATMMIPFPVTMIPLFVVFKVFGMTGTLMPLWVPAFFGGAFNIFLLRQFFMSIPNSLIEAAKIDGCSEFQIFTRIVLPLSRPILVVVALFHFMWSWNDFMGPLIYLTDQQTFTLSLGLQFFQSQHGGTEWHLLMAASTMVILPILVLFFFAQKTFIESIKMSGSKG